MTLHDKFGRQITDLRISVTDRCNFRCVYCRSADPENYREHDEILSWPESESPRGHLQNARASAKCALPVANPSFAPAWKTSSLTSATLGVEDISMTTNGHLLADRCASLVSAGLNRINISLDSLDPGKFERITRTKSFASVMKGIDAVQSSAARSRQNKCRARSRHQR